MVSWYVFRTGLANVIRGCRTNRNIANVRRMKTGANADRNGAITNAYGKQSQDVGRITWELGEYGNTTKVDVYYEVIVIMPGARPGSKEYERCQLCPNG